MEAPGDIPSSRDNGQQPFWMRRRLLKPSVAGTSRTQPILTSRRPESRPASFTQNSPPPRPLPLRYRLLVTSCLGDEVAQGHPRAQRTLFQTPEGGGRSTGTAWSASPFCTRSYFHPGVLLYSFVQAPKRCGASSTSDGRGAVSRRPATEVT